MCSAICVITCFFLRPVAFHYGYSVCNQPYVSSEDVVSDSQTRFWAYEEEITLSYEPRGGHVVFERLRHSRRRRFHPARVSYYSNTCATFNLEYLLLSGDIEANPGHQHAVGQARYSNKQSPKSIIRCLSLNARSICNKLSAKQAFRPTGNCHLKMERILTTELTKLS